VRHLDVSVALWRVWPRGGPTAGGDQGEEDDEGWAVWGRVEGVKGGIEGVRQRRAPEDRGGPTEKAKPHRGKGGDARKRGGTRGWSGVPLRGRCVKEGGCRFVCVLVSLLL